MDTISKRMDQIRKRTKDAYTKGIGTPNAAVEQRADNSAMVEIALILREFVADSSEHGITDTKYYHQKIDAVVAQLQQ